MLLRQQSLRYQSYIRDQQAAISALLAEAFAHRAAQRWILALDCYQNAYELSLLLRQWAPSYAILQSSSASLMASQCHLCLSLPQRAIDTLAAHRLRLNDYACQTKRWQYLIDRCQRSLEHALQDIKKERQTHVVT